MLNRPPYHVAVSDILDLIPPVCYTEGQNKMDFFAQVLRKLPVPPSREGKTAY